MTTRRKVIAWAALSPIAVALARGRAWAGPAPAAGSVLDAKTRKPLTVVKTGVFSIANANDRYVAVAELGTLPTEGPILVMAKGELNSGSWGSGFGTGGGAAHWEVDQATADRIAALWKTKRKDRTQLGAGLVVRWRAKQQPFRRGKPMIVVATVENTGTAAAGVQMGGRNYSRDEHFGFAGTKGGKPLPVVQLGGQAGGGAFQYKLMAPGDKVDLEVDLRGWLKLTKPGVYDLTCTYYSEVVPDTAGPQWPDRGAETWDLTVSGPLVVKVK